MHFKKTQGRNREGGRGTHRGSTGGNRDGGEGAVGRCGVPGESLGLSELRNGAGVLGRGWGQLDIEVYGAHRAEGTWLRCGQSSLQDAGPQASTAHRMADPLGDPEELPKENGGSGEDS